MVRPLASTASPAARAMLEQADIRWPQRDRSSDGILPSQEHIQQNPDSWHNAGLAVDLTHDPPTVDCGKLSELLRDNARRGEDNRPTVIIFSGQIATDASNWEWNSYSGDNPHTSHMHVTIRQGESHITAPWFDSEGTGPSIPGNSFNFSYPGQETIQNARQIFDMLNTIGDFVSDTRNWLRLLYIVSGGILVLVGTFLLGTGKTIGSVADAGQ